MKKVKANWIFKGIVFLLLVGFIFLVILMSDTTAKVNGGFNIIENGVNATIKGVVTGCSEAEENTLDLETITINDNVDKIEEGSKWNNQKITIVSSRATKISLTIENCADAKPLFVKINDTKGDIKNLKKYTTINDVQYDGEQLILPPSTGEGSSTKTVIISLKMINKREKIEKNAYNYEIMLQNHSFELDLENIQDVLQDEKLVYELDNKTMSASVKMKDLNITTGELVIPTYVKSGNNVYTVTKVAEKAFGNSTEGCSITKVTLPDTIEVIDKYGFSACENLAEINIPKNLKVVEYGAFNSTQIKEFICPEGVTIIGNYAFRNCAKLTKFVATSNLTNVGMNAFEGCENMLFNISENGKYIGPQENPYYIFIGPSNEATSTFTFNENCKVLSSGCFRKNASISKVIFPENIEYYNEATFYESTGIREAVLPSNLIAIPGWMFYKCTNLTTVTIPTNLKSVGKSAFYNCSNLVNIELPNTIEVLYSFAFSGCTKMDVKIPSSLRELHKCAFQNCYAIKDISLPTCLEFIGDYGLNHCNGATNTILTIPAGIKQIGGVEYDPNNPDYEVLGNHVLYDMATNSLREYVMAGSNQHYMTIDGVLYKHENGVPKVMVAYPPEKRDAVYEMPNTVEGAFELSLSRPYYLREIILSDAFVIEKLEADNLNNNSWGNSLVCMLYIYSGVTKITCRETNPNYMSYNGQVYSKDGTVLYHAPHISNLNKNDETQAVLMLKEGVTTIFFGTLGCDGDQKNGIYAPANNLDEANHLKRYDKLIIPASVTSIDEITISNINRQSWIIEVEEGNTIYQVNDEGKLELISQN